MQQPNAGSIRACSGSGLCPCASCSWSLHPAPTSAQDGLDPLQLLVVFSYSSFLYLIGIRDHCKIA